MFDRFLSPCISKFNKQEYEIISKDNSNLPASNYNDIIRESKNRYIILIHQDIIVRPDFLNAIRLTINNCSPFGVLGLVGHSSLEENGRIMYTATKNLSIELAFFDACCIVIDKNNDIYFDDRTFNDLHLYVEDYCIQALSKGLRNYTIQTDFEISDHYGNTSRTLNAGTDTVMWGTYGEYYEIFMRKWKR
jgi:hypothetical protein